MVRKMQPQNGQPNSGTVRLASHRINVKSVHNRCVLYNPRSQFLCVLNSTNKKAKPHLRDLERCPSLLFVEATAKAITQLLDHQPSS